MAEHSHLSSKPLIVQRYAYFNWTNCKHEQNGVGVSWNFHEQNVVNVK